MSNPFQIETPATCCFSGGRTSGKMLWEILQAFGGEMPPDFPVCFENTGKEREETLQFIHEVEQRWCPVIWLEYDDVFDPAKYNKGGKRKHFGPGDWAYKIVNFDTASRKGEPFAKMLRYYATYRDTIKGEPPILPTVPSRMCTTHLKIKTNTRFMQSQGYEEFNAVQGIRFDEPRRWAKMMAQNAKGSERYWNTLPLYDAKVVKQGVMNFWAMQPFDLDLDPESHAGNCDLCFLKNTPKLVKLVQIDMAENGGESPRIGWWLEREAKAGMTFRKDRSYAQILELASSGVVVPETDEPIIDCICGDPSV